MVSRNWIVVALVALGAAKFVPYLAAGPGFLLDDWRFAANVRFDGAWNVAHAGGATVRPGSFLGYVAMFGPSQSPLILAFELAVLNVAVAAVMFLVLRRWLPEWDAAAAAALWLVVPSHTGTDYWISGFGGPLALLLLGLGLLALAHSYEADRSMWVAGGLLVASVAVYELAVLVVLSALVVVPLLERRPIRRQASIITAGGVGMAAVVIWFQTPYVSRAWLDLPRAGALTFGDGVGAIVATVGVVVALVMTWHRERAGRPWGPGRRVLVGLVVMGLGIIPALRFPLGLDGFGDRVTVVAAIGTGVVVAALMARLPHRGVLLAGLLAASLVGGYGKMANYVDAAADGRAWVEENEGTRVVRSVDLPAPRGGVFSLCCDYVTTSAARVVTGMRDVEVRVVG